MNSAMTNVNILISRLTTHQWSAIDAEYLKPGMKADAKGISCLLLATILLTIKRYYGSTRIFNITFGNIVRDWPLPGMWAYLYIVFSSLILHFVIPALFIHFVFHERIRDHGFRFKGIGRYTRVYIIMFLVVLPFLIIASRSSDFTDKYPLYPNARNSWREFLTWESSYGVYFITLEFFFRGFLLFTMARYMGAYAIFLMVIPYVMVHFGKPIAETIGSIIAGIALGTLALRTRSIFGGVFIHTAVAWSMDILAITSIQ